MAVAVHLDVRELGQLPDAVVHYAAPLGEPWELRFSENPTAELGGRLRECHVVPALAQGNGCFEPSRPGPDDEHRLVGALLRDLLWMPAAPPLLPHGRVLSAANRVVHLIACVADVAADALADLVFSAFIDLVRQEGVGNGGASASDQVDNTLIHHAQHAVRRGKAPYADYRLVRQLLHVVDRGFEPPLLDEARRAHLEGVVVECHVPQIRKVLQDFDRCPRLFDIAGTVSSLSSRESDRHTALVTDRFLGVLKHLADQAHAVRQGAAVLVGPRVVRMQELRQQVPVTGVHVDDVVAGFHSADRSVAVPLAKLADIGLAHLDGL